jgi:alpha-glucuronidase
VAPFPNLRTLGPNVRWFADAGVRHVFLQGNGKRTEFAELRCYVLAKLAWDPGIDVEALIDEFLAGFYGDAAPHLRAYIDLLAR